MPHNPPYPRSLLPTTAMAPTTHLPLCCHPASMRYELYELHEVTCPLGRWAAGCAFLDEVRRKRITRSISPLRKGTKKTKYVTRVCNRERGVPADRSSMPGGDGCRVRRQLRMMAPQAPLPMLRERKRCDRSAA
jgi:hypothetical protein